MKSSGGGAFFKFPEGGDPEGQAAGAGSGGFGEAGNDDSLYD